MAARWNSPSGETKKDGEIGPSPPRTVPGGSFMSADWSRPHWRPTGQTASLFYSVPGEPPEEELRLSASWHHIDPQGAWQETLEMFAQDRARAPDLFASLFDPEGLGHDIDALFGPRAAALRAAGRGTMLRA